MSRGWGRQAGAPRRLGLTQGGPAAGGQRYFRGFLLFRATHNPDCKLKPRKSRPGSLTYFQHRIQDWNTGEQKGGLACSLTLSAARRSLPGLRVAIPIANTL